MADRDMSYDLDGIFATRQQGQLIASVPQQTKTLRTPGLAPMATTPMYKASGIGADPDTVTLPVLGPVNKKLAILAAVLGAVTIFTAMKQRRARA